MEAEYPFDFVGSTNWFLSVFELVHDFYKNDVLGAFEDDTRYIAHCIDGISYLARDIGMGQVPGYGVLVRELAEMAAELRTNRQRELFYTMKRPDFMALKN